MKRRTIFILMVVGLIIAVLAWFRFHQAKVVSPPPSPLTQEESVDLLKQRGELGLKKRFNAPIIATYEKLLLQYPESLDLKRKLAAAYEEIGEHEKAQRLLDEIHKKAPPP